VGNAVAISPHGAGRKKKKKAPHSDQGGNASPATAATSRQRQGMTGVSGGPAAAESGGGE
jgi:hypothetical protein